MRKTTVAAAAAAAVLAIPVMADFFQAQPVKTTVNARGSGMPNTVISRSKDGQICKSILITGSRLGSTPVCKDRKEWDDLAHQFRRPIERLQLNPSKVSGF